MKILIISGGNASERKISLLSAREVKKALAETGHHSTVYDLNKGYDKLGQILDKFDVAFPVIHGSEGEGGKIQTFLASHNKRFVGGDPKAFEKGWDKVPFKKFCNKNGIITAKWQLIHNKDGILKFGFPCVLKASSGGSSKEVFILKSPKDLNNAVVNKIVNLNDDLFIEEYLEGIEVTVGILDNIALPVLEIVPPQGSWFSYKNKYSGVTQEIPNAPSLTPAQRKEVQNLALKIHQILDLGHYSRVDFILKDKKFFVLEVNTIPGLTAERLFPKAAKAAGLSFPRLTDKLVKLALTR